FRSAQNTVETSTDASAGALDNAPSDVGTDTEAASFTPTPVVNPPPLKNDTRTRRRRSTPVAAKIGTLRIRAQKATLVSVNGKPVGMTPLNLDREAGRYVITAKVEGKSREEKVDLKPGTIRLVEF
ncbi:MAG: hypothetical protein ACI9MC_003645, partial [Kiritimatiellia bacterium]